MFLRRYSRTKNGKTHVYFALVESTRTDAGPRQRVVAHLGELNHTQERRWQRAVVCYNRQGDAQEMLLFPDDDSPLPDEPNVARIRLDKVGWTNGRRFGDIWLARWLWRLLQLDQIVARHIPSGKRPSRPLMSSPWKSSIACASRAASSPWPSIGTPRRVWRIC